MVGSCSEDLYVVSVSLRARALYALKCIPANLVELVPRILTFEM